MEQELELVFRADFVLESFDFLGLKLNHATTADADHVIVVPFGACSLEVFSSSIPHRFLNHPAFQ